MKRKLIIVSCIAMTCLLLGAFRETYQMGYNVLRSGVTTDDTPLDGTTEGYTYCFADKPAKAATGDPAGAIRVHPAWNNAQVIFWGSDAADEACNYKLYAWREDGPAALVCSGTFTLGTAYAVATDPNYLYADTITATDVWPTEVVVSDSGNNRVASVAFDLLGYSWLYCEIDIPASGQVATASAKISGF